MKPGTTEFEEFSEILESENIYLESDGVTPTYRKSGSVLDHIFARSGSRIEKTTVTDAEWSDHQPVEAVVKVLRSQLRKSKLKETIPVRKFNIEKCKSQLIQNQENLNAENVNKVELLNDCFEKAMEKPKDKKKTFHKPYYNAQLRDMRRKVMAQWRKVKILGISNARYVFLRSAYHKAVKNAEKKHNEQKCLEMVEEALEKGIQSFYSKMKDRTNGSCVDTVLFVDYLEELFNKEETDNNIHVESCELENDLMKLFTKEEIQTIFKSLKSNGRYFPQRS